MRLPASLGVCTFSLPWPPWAALPNGRCQPRAWDSARDAEGGPSSLPNGRDPPQGPASLRAEPWAGPSPGPSAPTRLRLTCPWPAPCPGRSREETGPLLHPALSLNRHLFRGVEIHQIQL